MISIPLDNLLRRSLVRNLFLISQIQFGKLGMTGRFFSRSEGVQAVVFHGPAMKLVDGVDFIILDLVLEPSLSRRGRQAGEEVMDEGNLADDIRRHAIIHLSRKHHIRDMLQEIRLLLL